jgi:hypothetical protein
MYKQLRRILRDLIHYLKKNPVKVFMLVIMPLITGGVLTGLLAKFGLRLPHGIERMIAKLGGHAGSSYGSSSIGRGSDGGLQFERKSYSGSINSLGGMSGMLGGLGGASTLLGVAKAFL